MIFYGHEGAMNGDILGKEHRLEMRTMTDIYNIIGLFLCESLHSSSVKNFVGFSLKPIHSICLG